MAEEAHVQKLAQRAGAGDRRAFGELYGRYRAELLAFVRRRVLSPEDAEDLVEQAFYKALRSVERRDSAGPFNAWLFHITLNLIRDFYRARKPSPDVPPEESVDESVEASAEDTALEAYVDERIASALATLTARQRWVIQLRFFEGLTYAEVAERLGCKEGAVRAVQMRALRCLREALGVDVPGQRASA